MTHTRSWLLGTLLLVALAWTLAVTTPAAPAYDRRTVITTPDPSVQQMIALVQTSTLTATDGGLSGEWPVLVGGQPYTITTRHTDSGVPVEKATQYAYERLQAAGLAAGYHNWSAGGHAGRNVIGEWRGTLYPNEIVVVCAHLDSISDAPGFNPAPGADDNASGSTAVLTLADIMRGYRFERTLRFVLFTGEEQGLYGSTAYAEYARAQGDNIVAVYNVDMIAWDALDGPVAELHTRTTDDPDYPLDLAIANVYTNVVQVYGLSLAPGLHADALGVSDHSRFWQQGYPAILAIEDDTDDFNPYYHTVNDRLAAMNWTYFTNFVRASVATAAHLAVPLGPLPPTPTGTPPTPTTTPPPTATPCYGPNVLANAGFESGDFTAWTVVATSPAPAITTTLAHGGQYAAAIGQADPVVSGDSALYQEFAVPPGGAVLTFWYWPYSWDGISFDWQEVDLTDTSNQRLTRFLRIGSNAQSWVPARFDLAPYAGQTVRLRFLVHNGNGWNPTYLVIDDLSVQAPTACVPSPRAYLPFAAYNTSGP